MGSEVMPHLNEVGATSVARKIPLTGTLPSGPGKVRHYRVRHWIRRED